jgi:phage tail-like protein
MATKQRETDWLKKEMFTVEIEGITWGHFAAVSGGNAEVEVITYKNSDEQWERKRPGRIKYTNITLERGFIDDNQFKDWIKTVENGEPIRKSGSILAMDDNGDEIARWNFYEAWPCKWEGPNFDSSATGEHLMEKIELAIEKIERS